VSAATVVRLARAALTLAAAVSLCAGARAQEAMITGVPPGTPVTLMVTKEVSSRTARLGDRFRLRVNQAVLVGGVVAVPVGATAWGEIVSAAGTGVAGNRGRLTARLSHVELPGGSLRLTGAQAVEGKANTAGLVIGVVTFGIGGLLMKGGNALLKAGDILTGIVADPDPRAPLCDTASATSPCPAKE
jgi:hypothetical protein